MVAAMADTRLVRMLAILVVVLSPSGAKPAEADALLLTQGHNLDGGCLSGQNSGAVGPVQLTSSCSNSISSASAFGLADFGRLGVEIFDSYDTGTSLRTSAGSLARFAAEYVVSGPAGTINTQFTLDLNGAMQQTCGAGLCTNNVIVTAEGPGMFTRGDTIRFNGAFFQQGVWDLSSLFQAGGASLSLTTLPFAVTIGVPFQITVTLSTIDDFGGGGNGTTSNDLAHTLTFHMGGDVFTLPAGYTVNGAGLVDNRFGDAAAVPEPAALALLGLGLGAVGVRIRRRKAIPGVE